jgi:hypothetical protein
MDYQNTVMGKNTELKLHGNYKMQKVFIMTFGCNTRKNQEFQEK